jgi:hypothetical protein
MKTNKVLLTILLATLTLSLFAPTTLAVEEDKPVIVAHLKGALEPDVQLEAIMDNMTYFEWRVVLGELTSNDLSDAQMLIMSKADSAVDYTESELSVISTWMAEGEKALWVAADSDFGDDQRRQPTANDVLVAVNSKLRIESCSAEDPNSNAGAPYRVYGVSENVDEEVAFLTNGVDTALFHGPGIIIGIIDEEYHSLDEVPWAFVIMTTTDSGIVVNNNPPDAEVHGIGEEGNFPLLALELVDDSSNIIIASGESPFDQYTGMYMPQLRDYERYIVEYPQQGAKLFNNIVNFAIEYRDEFIELHTTIMNQNTQIEDLQTQMDELEEEIDTLESQNNQLDEELASTRGQVSTWQMVAVALLIVGLIVGYLAGTRLS